MKKLFAIGLITGLIAGASLGARASCIKLPGCGQTGLAVSEGLSSPSPASSPTATLQTSSLESQASNLQQGTGLLGLPPMTDPGARKAAQLLEQMVMALGGQAYLNLQDMEQEGRTYGFYHGEPGGTGALFWRFWKWPDKDRMELTKQRDWVVLFVGDQGYEITFRGTGLVEKEQLEDYLRRRNHSLSWVLRKWLKEPGVALFYEGSGVAERKQADQVSVLNAENDGVTIAIDSNSHLPLRIGFTWRDPKTRDRTDDAEGYDNYQPVQGIMTPFSITRYRNGDPVNQRFITATKYNQNFAASLFAAQLTAPPAKGKSK